MRKRNAFVYTSTRALDCPCYGCDHRTPTCHADCEGYARYREEVEKVKAREREAKKRGL